MKIICILKTIWYSIQRPAFFKDFIPICGCDYVEQENGDLVCKRCGNISKTNKIKCSRCNDNGCPSCENLKYNIKE